MTMFGIISCSNHILNHTISFLDVLLLQEVVPIGGNFMYSERTTKDHHFKLSFLSAFEFPTQVGRYY